MNSDFNNSAKSSSLRRGTLSVGPFGEWDWRWGGRDTK
jgi:hypothetical protein